MQGTEPELRVRVAALIISEGRILLAEHKKRGERYWLLPGGGLEYGETLEEALKRELLEEAGIGIQVKDLLWTLDSIPPDKHRHVLNLIFEAEALSDRLSPVKEEVLQGVRWVSLEEFPKLVLYPDTKKEIVEHLNGQRSGRRNLGQRWDG